jgi:DNA-binding transcriptional MerR regulator
MTIRDVPRLQKRPMSDPTMLNPDEVDRQFTIGELAEAFGVTTRAIRFYESKGLISPPRKGVARSYSRRERARLSLIQRGKNLGFSLEEIRDWLALYDADPNHITQARVLIEKVEAAVEDLTKKRADLDRAIKDLREIKNLAVNHLKAHNAKDA